MHHLPDWGSWPSRSIRASLIPGKVRKVMSTGLRDINAGTDEYVAQHQSFCCCSFCYYCYVAAYSVYKVTENRFLQLAQPR